MLLSGPNAIYRPSTQLRASQVPNTTYDVTQHILEHHDTTYDVTQHILEHHDTTYDVTQ